MLRCSDFFPTRKSWRCCWRQWCATRVQHAHTRTAVRSLHCCSLLGSVCDYYTIDYTHTLIPNVFGWQRTYRPCYIDDQNTAHAQKASVRERGGGGYLVRLFTLLAHADVVLVRREPTRACHFLLCLLSRSTLGGGAAL